MEAGVGDDLLDGDHVVGGLAGREELLGLVVVLQRPAVVVVRGRVEVVAQGVEVELGDLLAEDGDVLVHELARDAPAVLGGELFLAPSPASPEHGSSLPRPPAAGRASVAPAAAARRPRHRSRRRRSRRRRRPSPRSRARRSCRRRSRRRGRPTRRPWRGCPRRPTVRSGVRHGEAVGLRATLEHQLGVPAAGPRGVRGPEANHGTWRLPRRTIRTRGGSPAGEPLGVAEAHRDLARDPAERRPRDVPARGSVAGVEEARRATGRPVRAVAGREHAGVGVPAVGQRARDLGDVGRRRPTAPGAAWRPRRRRGPWVVQSHLVVEVGGERLEVQGGELLAEAGDVLVGGPAHVAEGVELCEPRLAPVAPTSADHPVIMPPSPGSGGPVQTGHVISVVLFVDVSGENTPWSAPALPASCSPPWRARCCCPSCLRDGLGRLGAEPRQKVETWATPGSTAITLTGHGFGHGKGLSQYGALGAAAAGADLAADRRVLLPRHHVGPDRRQGARAHHRRHRPRRPGGRPARPQGHQPGAPAHLAAAADRGEEVATGRRRAATPRCSTPRAAPGGPGRRSPARRSSPSVDRRADPRDAERAPRLPRHPPVGRPAPGPSGRPSTSSAWRPTCAASCPARSPRSGSPTR